MISVQLKDNLKWICAVPILLVGIYYMYGISDLRVISNQINLINAMKEGIDQAKKSTDQYVVNFEEYCELKVIDDSWFSSLSEQQKDHMHKLRDHLGLNTDIKIPDVKTATSIVREASKQTIEILSIQLTMLEDALCDMNMEEMKKLQYAINKEQLSVFSEVHMEHIKSQIISKSTELQAQGGVVKQIFLMFIDFLNMVLSKVVMPLTAKVIYKVLSEMIL